MRHPTMAARRTKVRGIPEGIKHDHSVLVLQGGGALGAYQAGVYEGMAEHGFAPDWVAGVSIGAINAALIAGNPPQKRLERLREFWDRVSSGISLVAPAQLDPVRVALNRLSAATAATGCGRKRPNGSTSWATKLPRTSMRWTGRGR